MGCSCKNGNTMDEMLSTDKKKITSTQKVSKYTLKVIAFLLMLLALPLINLYLIWLMFKMLVMNEDIDIKPLLMAIGNKFKNNQEDYDDDDFEEDFNEEDLITVNVEDISNKTK